MVAVQAVIRVVYNKPRFRQPLTQVLTGFHFVFDDQYFHRAPLTGC